MRKRQLLALIPFGLVMGCSQMATEPPEQATPVAVQEPLTGEAAFISELSDYEDHPLHELGDEDALVLWGETMCDYIELGHDPLALSFQESRDGLLSQFDAQVGIELSIMHLCPEYDHLI